MWNDCVCRGGCLAWCAFCCWLLRGGFHTCWPLKGSHMIDRMDLAGLVYAVDRSHSKSILPTQNKLFTDEGNELGVSEKVEMVITVN